MFKNMSLKLMAMATVFQGLLLSGCLYEEG